MQRSSGSRVVPTSLLLLLALSGCNGAKDGKSDSAQSSNASPVLTLDNPVQDAVYQGSLDTAAPNVAASGFVVDQEDPPALLTLSFTDAPDGDLGTAPINDDGTFSAEFTISNGPHAFSATVTDSGGLSTTTSVGFTMDVPTNAAPEITALDIAPLAPHVGDTLVATITADDADGDPLTSTINWSESTTGLTATGDSVPNVLLGQVWTATATVNDGHVDSAAVSTTVTVVNAPPTATAILVTPSSGTPDDTFVCSAQDVNDLDGDPVSISFLWLVDGAEVAGGDTLTPADFFFAKHANLLCEASLSDGVDTTVMDSAVVDVVDRAPDAPVVTVSPVSPLDTDDLACSATGSDPDGDALSYTYLWSVDGVATAYTSASVPASATHKDETWTCTATADDGDGGATSTDSSVTIDIAFQSTGAASDADVVIDGQTSNGAFGKTIALLGDTNGDGLSELLVGASGEDGGGRMYLFDGAGLSGALTTNDAIASWANTETNADLGGYRSITAAGDVDGDGLSDLFFGAALSDANGEDGGAAYFYYGGGDFSVGQSLDTADWTVLGALNDYSGARLTTGDLDGDGLDDIVVASPGASDGARQSGTVSVFYGTGARLSGTGHIDEADYAITGDHLSDQLGWTTKFVGDVNDDGVDDLFTAAIYDDDGAADGGVGGLISGGSYSGAATLTDASVTTFTGDGASDRFGYDATGYDADGDGINDMLVGEYQDGTNGADSGTLRVYFGGERWASGYTPTDADYSVYGGAAGDRFAHILQNAGDVDGDGKDDLLIGALFASPDGRSYAGSGYLSLGGDILDAGYATDIRWRRDGEAASDLFGDATAFGSGDVNGDGADEIVFGAQGYDGGASGAGRVYLWFGKP